MSSAMDIHEQIRIRSGSAQAKALIEALKQYIQQINHMTCLEYIQNLRLTLSDGSDTIVCEAEIPSIIYRTFSRLGLAQTLQTSLSVRFWQMRQQCTLFLAWATASAKSRASSSVRESM